jgi:protein-S-isoprenylcysteine O-methyltransferase Ste14
MTDEQILRLAAGLVFLSGIIPSMYYRKQSESQGEKVSWKAEGMFVMICLRVFGMAMWLSVMAFFVYPAAISWAQFSLPMAVRWSALGMAVLMVPALIWVFRSIGKNITQTVGIRSNHKLITDGAYRWIRHPLYTFGMLNFVAYGVMAANWLILLFCALGMIMLLIRLPNEEEKLIEAFGEEYIEYKKRTGALFPRLL